MGRPTAGARAIQEALRTGAWVEISFHFSTGLFEAELLEEGEDLDFNETLGSGVGNAPQNALQTLMDNLARKGKT